jgi:hypothetical protein
MFFSLVPDCIDFTKISIPDIGVKQGFYEVEGREKQETGFEPATFSLATRSSTS